jgi:hypothetical protein
MILRIILLCGLALPSLASCSTDPVKPSPTSDQIFAEQYRASGSQGAITGMEADAIAQSYGRQVARPSHTEQPGSNPEQAEY